MSFKDTGYAYEFFENAASIDTATDVSVMAGATTRIDAQMDSGGSISGRVTDVNGSPLEWVQVSVYDSITSWYIGYVNTDSNGNYQINGLRTGSYFVEYWDTSSWTWFYYENSTSMDTATAVAVIQGIETPNIDGQFSFVAAREKTAVKALGTIEGAITDEQGTPLPGVWTQLYRNNGGFFEWVDSGNSDDSGHYVFSNVSSGTYAIEFQQNGFKREFYNDAYSAETATPIVLSDTPITNIDVQLYAYPYSINGKVTASGSGIPLAGIYLSASTYMGGFYSVFEFTSTDVCGNYSVAVDPGDYLLQTQDWYNRWATTYNNQLDIVGTSLITVTSSDQVLDVQLGTAGKVTGVVKDANGNPVGNIDVYAYKWNGVGLWVLVAQASTAPDGSFNLDGVTGTVRLQFNDYQTGQTYFYPGTTNSENADDIYVDTGTTLALEMSLIDYSCYTGNRGYSGSVYADRRVDLSAEGIVFNSGSVDVQPGATLGFTSPVQIILNPGFHAMAGSTFTATIAPVTCN
jgi:protocatechuate 3,4-dioxygenase beta subunit